MRASNPIKASQPKQVSLVTKFKVTRTTCRVFKLPMIGKELDGQAGFRLSRLFEDGPGKLVVIVDGRRHGGRGIEVYQTRSPVYLFKSIGMITCVSLSTKRDEIESGRCDVVVLVACSRLNQRRSSSCILRAWSEANLIPTITSFGPFSSGTRVRGTSPVFCPHRCTQPATSNQLSSLFCFS
jgi:hypothetical protein